MPSGRATVTSGSDASSATQCPDIPSAAVIQPVMTAVGLFTFLAGVLYLPALAPGRVEMIGLLLLLAAVALLCHAVAIGRDPRTSGPAE